MRNMEAILKYAVQTTMDAIDICILTMEETQDIKTAIKSIKQIRDDTPEMLKRIFNETNNGG